MILKYFAGWITSESVDPQKWYDAVMKQAKELEEENHTLIIFKIPTHKPFDQVDQEDIRFIESYLQSKYK